MAAIEIEAGAGAGVGEEVVMNSRGDGCLMLWSNDSIDFQRFMIPTGTADSPWDN